MLCKVDVGGVVSKDDIVDVKTGSFRQPHACVGDEGDKPPSLIVLHLTVLLYAPDVLQRYGLTSLVILKVRQIDTRESVTAVEAMLLDAQVDNGANGREEACNCLFIGRYKDTYPHHLPYTQRKLIFH